MNFRFATHTDAEKIAELHAKSWQKAYRGSFTNDFLDNHALENRKTLWHKRFHENENQITILCENNQTLIGFICIFTNNGEFGPLIDNLHIAEQYQGQGIGKMLIDKAKEYIRQKALGTKMHLFVLEKNENAIHFYQKLGARNNNAEIYTSPDGLQLKIFKMVWDDLF
jgi:ribosomal protein S18 acetylase RimI-like enzyme